jgi:hypothetical protein
MTLQAAAALAALLTFASPSPAAGGDAQAAAPFPVIGLDEPQPTSHRWAYLSMAAGAGLVGASFLYADRANALYDDYLAATDPGRITSLYDETVHYDRLSAGTLVAGEALLAVGIYLRFLHRPGDSSLELTLVPTRCEVSFRF